MVRYLKDSAVVLANSAQVTELAHVAETLSGDLPVAPFMSVSNSSTAADQVRSGTSGLLLGIGGISGVTGQGITVAVVDSGIDASVTRDNQIIWGDSVEADDPQ